MTGACGSLQSRVGWLCCCGPACIGAWEHGAALLSVLLSICSQHSRAPPQHMVRGWDRALPQRPGPAECLCTLVFQLMHKLSVEAPPKILVERYLIEIAKNYNVPYEPDSVVMVSEVSASLEVPSVFQCLKCPVSAVRAFGAQGCGVAGNSLEIVLWYLLDSPSITRSRLLPTATACGCS